VRAREQPNLFSISVLSGSRGRPECGLNICLWLFKVPHSNLSKVCVDKSVATDILYSINYREVS